MWFKKSPPAPAGQPEPSGSASTADTLADVLRTLGRYALPTQRFPAPDFRASCEKAARALLVGERAERESLLRTIRSLVRDQRQAESTEYQQHRESAHIIVADLVARLRRELEERERQDAEIVGALAEMEQAVQAGDLRRIKQVCSRTVHHIRDVLTVQRDAERQKLRQLTDQLRDMKRELETVKADAQRDPLTGVFNRGAFDDTFSRTVSVALTEASDLTVLLVDLDHFKSVNDTWGHQAGDEVLRQVATQLVRCFPRRDDLVARYGGEEFVVVCKHTGDRDAPMLAQRACDAVRKRAIAVGGQDYHQTISVGWACLTPEDTPRSLLERADIHLYAAKRSGRDRIHPPAA